MFSALIKLEVSADSGAELIGIELDDGVTFDPLNCRFLWRARRVWTICIAAWMQTCPETPSASSSSEMPIGIGVKAKRKRDSIDRYEGRLMILSMSLRACRHMVWIRCELSRPSDEVIGSHLTANAAIVSRKDLSIMSFLFLSCWIDCSWDEPWLPLDVSAMYLSR